MASTDPGEKINNFIFFFNQNSSIRMVSLAHGRNDKKENVHKRFDTGKREVLSSYDFHISGATPLIQTRDGNIVQRYDAAQMVNIIFVICLTILKTFIFLGVLNRGFALPRPRRALCTIDFNPL